MGCAMGTKMAPSYASLFMGKFEEDKLREYHHQPLIWLRFLDEKELLDFIKYLNGAHPSIKFTHINILLKKQHFLMLTSVKTAMVLYIYTSVHIKKDKQSSVHSILLVPSFIMHNQAKRYRRVISYDENFEKVKSYLLERNYPTHVVDDAFQKACSLSRDMALKETAKSKNTLVPYVITYNPNIGEIIKKYWGLLALSQNPSVKYVFHINLCWL